MSWSDVGGIATSIGVIGSLLFAGMEYRRSKNSAARSEAAAQLSEHYTARVVDSLEQIASSGTPGLVQRPPRVKWSMIHESGETYMLTNVGDAQAYDVQLTGDPTLVGPMATAGGPDLHEGEALTFVAAQTLSTRDSTITVTWSMQPDDDRLEWRYPLPSAR